MPPKIPFLDLRITSADERRELLAAVEQVFLHGRLVLGPEVAELEGKVAARCQRAHAVGVNSGSDALYLALRALDIGPGDEVITTPLSFVATANAIALTGATPVFGDIADDLTLDPASVEPLITARTKALLPVHYAGKVADMFALQAIAQRRNLLLVEDAAQAFTARYHDRPAGSFGELACFSMNSMKVFASLGEAGMVVCDRPELAARLEALRYNGLVNREVCAEPGPNGRLDTLHAAMLLRRLDWVDALIARRREIAARYNAALSDVVGVPREAPHQHDVCYVYAIRTPRRDELLDYLSGEGVEAKLRDRILMPDQPAYRGKTVAECPRARRLVPTLLCLPAHEGLTDAQVDTVAAAVRAFFERG